MLEDGDMLSLPNQYRLLQLIRYRLWHGRQLQQNRHLDVRVMVTASVPGAFEQAVGQGRFREDLYYLVKGLDIRIPPLRQRKEDLKQKLGAAIRESCERYGRYHVLTREAEEVLLNCPWFGNLYQVEHFCERLILTATKRSLDEWAVREVLDELFGGKENLERKSGKKDSGSEGNLSQDAEDGWPDERSRQIAAALKKHGGNRKKTAEELGISKATLWRQMKKYGLGRD